MIRGCPTAVSIGKAIGRMSKELLFDTGALIDIYKGRQRIKPFFDTVVQTNGLSFMSVISEAELWRGLHSEEVNRHEALLSQFVIIPLRTQAARVAGYWMQQYRNTGLGWMDALIVGTAVVADVPVLTRDKRLANVLADQANFQLYV